MATPAKASSNYVIQFGAMLEENASIDEFTYRYVLRNYSSSTEGNDVSAVGFAYALNGEDDLAYEHFHKHLKMGNITIAKNFAAFLFKRHHYRQLHEIIYQLADAFGGKMLTMLAAAESYRVGDLAAIQKYMEWHCRLLSENDDKNGAEAYMHELIDGVKGCYEAKVCTPEQFRLLGDITHSILEERKLIPGSLGIFSSMGGDYLVQVEKATPEDIVLMNFNLAERICSESRLDDCEMTARFSVLRESHTKETYDYSEF
ncbi:TPA: hypothetical protein HMT16_26805 [Escherichia coli]|nr:hypothetical protein [Escherichia coli]HAJ2807888.1 hypothetical protein [Escherichia coli]HAJ2824340.1 hypothetical protein [Escherichia coli]HAJ2864183.1 hypothetical protein [Escherichia coli]